MVKVNDSRSKDPEFDSRYYMKDQSHDLSPNGTYLNKNGLQMSVGGT